MAISIAAAGGFSSGILVESMHLTAHLYFAAALRVGADSAYTRLLPLAALREPLVLHGRFSQRMLLALQALGYIEPELTLSHAEDWLYSRDWITHGFANVSWPILKPPGSAIGALRNWAEGDDTTTAALETWVEIWEDLALAEVAEYARWSLARSAFNRDWADEATSSLQQGLKHFGANQVMYLVHFALRSIALTHQRGGRADCATGPCVRVGDLELCRARCD